LLGGSEVATAKALAAAVWRERRQVSITGASIFNNNSTGTGSNYSNAIIPNNIRGQHVTDATRPPNSFFGERSATRDPQCRTVVSFSPIDDSLVEW